MRRLDHYWYSLNPVAIVLLPLAALFCLLSWLRRLAYRHGLIASHTLPVPVIVVGNITVGGSGKTPLVIWLANYLQARGLRPGIISRGYGGQAAQWPQPVDADSDPRLVGDEPVLIARRTRCPLWVGPDRVAAARALLRAHNCNVLISDDGLQHYRMRRNVEIAVIDGARRFGNGFCLPAGPLRERPARLRTVDLRVVNGAAMADEHAMQLQVDEVYSLHNRVNISLDSFVGRRVHALAGIGNPARFFQLLRDRGIEVEEHAFPDHYRYSAADLQFADDLPVLMTEKDAVKCRMFTNESMWAVRVSAQLPEAFGDEVLSLLARKFNG